MVSKSSSQMEKAGEDGDGFSWTHSSPNNIQAKIQQSSLSRSVEELPNLFSSLWRGLVPSGKCSDISESRLFPRIVRSHKLCTVLVLSPWNGMHTWWTLGCPRWENNKHCIPENESKRAHGKPYFKRVVWNANCDAVKKNWCSGWE